MPSLPARQSRSPSGSVRPGSRRPHLFDASDKKREVQAALDRETRAVRQRRLRRKLFLDYLIERVEGRSLTATELDRTKAEIARRLLRHVGLGRKNVALRAVEIARRPANTLTSTHPRQRAD
jgi:hypothetical protein